MTIWICLGLLGLTVALQTATIGGLRERWYELSNRETDDVNGVRIRAVRLDERVKKLESACKTWETELAQTDKWIEEVENYTGDLAEKVKKLGDRFDAPLELLETNQVEVLSNPAYPCEPVELPPEVVADITKAMGEETALEGEA